MLKNVKLKTQLMMIIGVILVLTGCTTVQLVPTLPICSSYPEPVLKLVNSEKELKGKIEKETFEKLRKNEEMLLNWGRTNQSIIDEVCRKK